MATIYSNITKQKAIELATSRGTVDYNAPQVITPQFTVTNTNSPTLETGLVNNVVSDRGFQPRGHSPSGKNISSSYP